MKKLNNQIFSKTLNTPHSSPYKRDDKMKRKPNLSELKTITNSKLLLAFTILIVGTLAYFFITNLTTCQDLTCFKESLTTCKKTTLIREEQNMVWEYQIIGNGPGDTCKVKTTLLKVIEGKAESQTLQGKSMTCNYPISTLNLPEDDISTCTGPLREELQELIIQRMHNYLIKNIGEIKEDFKDF